MKNLQRKKMMQRGNMSMSAYDKIMDERKKLVEKIIENMKQGYILPKPDWNQEVFPDTRIRNPVSGARYHGGNLIRLYITGLEKGYTDGRWMTYKQAQSEGWRVKKGEQGVRCEKYIFTKQVEERNPETGMIEKKTVPLSKPMVNTFIVFNAAQIEGIPERKIEELEPLKQDEILEMAEHFQESSMCPIQETREGKETEYGRKYVLRIKGFESIDCSGEIKVIIPEGVMKDSSENKNKDLLL